MALTENDVYRIAYRKVSSFFVNEDLPYFENVDGYSFIKGAFTVAEGIVAEISKHWRDKETNEDTQ